MRPATGNCRPARSSACSPAATGFLPPRIDVVSSGRCEHEPVIRDSGLASRPRNDRKIASRSPFSHGWYATTADHRRGILSVKRAIFAIFGLLVLAGCAADTKSRNSRPCMSAWPRRRDARPAGRSVMISQYRQNNGLGTVVVDPGPDEACRAAVAGDGRAQQDGPRRERRRSENGWKPPAIPPPRRSKMSRPAITPWRKPFRAGAIRRRTRPICSRTVSQNWASRRVMLRTPSTRCSGRSFWHQPEASDYARVDKLGVILASISPD